MFFVAAGDLIPTNAISPVVAVVVIVVVLVAVVVVLVAVAVFVAVVDIRVTAVACFLLVMIRRLVLMEMFSWNCPQL